jgi:hypothetical protein
VAGYREFVSGEVLTAVNVNDFLMEQSVMTFEDGTARDAALAAVLREGITIYNEATKRNEVYNGTAWVPVVAGIGSNVVASFESGNITTTSTTFANLTGSSVTITPSTNTSQVLVMWVVSNQNDSAAQGTPVRVLRDATGLRAREIRGVVNLPYLNADVILDSPATDSPVVYQLQHRLNVAGTGNTASRLLVAIEVKA